MPSVAERDSAAAVEASAHAGADAHAGEKPVAAYCAEPGDAEKSKLWTRAGKELLRGLELLATAVVVLDGMTDFGEVGGPGEDEPVTPSRVCNLGAPACYTFKSLAVVSRQSRG